MALCGGMRGGAPSLVYPIWLAIISQFLVWFKSLFSDLILTWMVFEATTVDVERVFFRGRQVLPFVRSRLSAQSTCALMCIGSWSLLGLIKDSDIKAALELDLVNGQEEELAAGWDSITKE